MSLVVGITFGGAHVFLVGLVDGDCAQPTQQ